MGILVPDPTLYPAADVYPSMPWPVVTSTTQHGGSAKPFKGRTLADERELNAHVARLLAEERRRLDDEAIVLLLCA